MIQIVLALAIAQADGGTAGIGEGCIDQQGNTIFCQGTDPGCLEEPTGAVCTENLGPCVAGDVDTCDGERWISACNGGQPYVVDCDSYGGMCGTNPSRCFDLPNGSFCGADFLCAAGSICGPLGLCQSDPNRDGGVAERDAGERDGGVSTAPVTNDDDEGGCGCTASDARGSVWAALLLSAALVGSRRRSRSASRRG